MIYTLEASSFQNVDSHWSKNFASWFWNYVWNTITYRTSCQNEFSLNVNNIFSKIRNRFIRKKNTSTTCVPPNGRNKNLSFFVNLKYNIMVPASRRTHWRYTKMIVERETFCKCIYIFLILFINKKFKSTRTYNISQH